MRKFILSVLAVAMLATSVVFAQETERTIGMYLDANSGYLAGNRNRKDDSVALWDDNEFEVGFTYAQNFAGQGMDWLAASLTFYGIASQDNASSGSYVADSDTAKYIGAQDFGGGLFGKFIAELGVTANGSVFGVDALDLSLAVDTSVKVTFGAEYGMEVGPGALTFGLGVEFYAYPLHEKLYTDFSKNAYNVAGASYDGEHYKEGNQIFDSVYLTVGYGLEFAEIWSVQSVLEVGFANVGGAVYYEEKSDKSDWDAAGIFNHDLYIQWDIFEIAANLDGGFSAWAGLRLTAENLINGGKLTENVVDASHTSGSVYEAAGVDVALALRAGISYDFNF